MVESSEVRFNGGLPDPYPPGLLEAGRTHPSTQLLVQAVGTDLTNAARIEIAAPDSLWQLPLAIVQQSANGFTATAQVAADLPACLLRVISSSGATATFPLAADTASLLSVQPACTNYVKEINLISHEDIQPRDFTIIASRDSFHVFYTRQDYSISDPNLDSKIIGHKRSRDLYAWFPTEHTMSSVQARPGMWDGLHAWAPSIIKKPGDITYYMFYTGVDAAAVQRIGVATSVDLNVWSQDATYVYETSRVTWALPGTPEFRDPFVMPDPDSPGRYLMYFVTVSKDRRRYVVGVARTDPSDPSNLRAWQDLRPLWNTDSLHSGAKVIESPAPLLGLQHRSDARQRLREPRDRRLQSYRCRHHALERPRHAVQVRGRRPDAAVLAQLGVLPLVFELPVPDGLGR